MSKATDGDQRSSEQESRRVDREKKASQAVEQRIITDFLDRAEAAAQRILFGDNLPRRASFKWLRKFHAKEGEGT